jgi:hypothetical protein
VFVFRNRTGRAIKVLAYDGQGFWLCQKRLSRVRFRYWQDCAGVIRHELLAHQFQPGRGRSARYSNSHTPEWTFTTPLPTISRRRPDGNV